MNLKTCYKGGNGVSEEPGYWLGFDYDQDFIEILKASIPATHRIWDDKQKLWWVLEDYDSTLRKLFSNFYALIHLQGKLF